jgi:hypothetical protein
MGEAKKSCQWEEQYLSNFMTEFGLYILLVCYSYFISLLLLFTLHLVVNDGFRFSTIFYSKYRDYREL